VRFDAADDGVKEISIGVAPAARGRSLGAAAIDAGVTRVFSDSSAARVVARIKPDNERSIASFRNADFDPAGRETADGEDVLLYSRNRDAGLA